jgi:hypothetical protein
MEVLVKLIGTLYSMHPIIQEIINGRAGVKPKSIDLKNGFFKPIKVNILGMLRV